MTEKKLHLFLIFTSLCILVCTYIYMHKTESLDKNEIFFSHNSGFYDNEFYLKISANPKYKIRYTIDNSLPNTNSTEYEEPILIKDATTNENQYTNFLLNSNFYNQINKTKEKSNDITKSFSPTNENIPKCTVINVCTFNEYDEIVSCKKDTFCVGFDRRKEFTDIPIFMLNFDKNDLYSNKKGLLTNYDFFIDKITNNLSCNEIIRSLKKNVKINIYNNKKKLIYTNNGLCRVSGGISRFSPQKSFKLYSKGIKNKFFANKKGNSLILDSCSTDIVKLKDKIVFTAEENVRPIYEHREYIPSATFINGEFHGANYIKEDVNESYIKSKYKIKDNNLYMIKDRRCNTPNAYVDFQITTELIKDLKFSDISKLIDIESFVNYYASNIYADNAEVTNFANSVLFKNVKEDKKSRFHDNKWRAINKDFNATHAMKYSDFCLICGYYANDSLFRSLMQHEEFYTLLRERLILLKNKAYTADNINKIIKEYNRNFSPIVKLTNEIYYSGNNKLAAEEYNEIINFFMERDKVVLKAIDDIYKKINATPN